LKTNLLEKMEDWGIGWGGERRKKGKKLGEGIKK
jgi:hypothetical protein